MALMMYACCDSMLVLKVTSFSHVSGALIVARSALLYMWKFRKRTVPLCKVTLGNDPPPTCAGICPITKIIVALSGTSKDHVKVRHTLDDRPWKVIVSVQYVLLRTANANSIKLAGVAALSSKETYTLSYRLTPIY
jgi:hypothetical protein